jgi:hypothetical protein
MTGSSNSSASRNPWITRAGALVFVALAVGLIVAVGGASAGYGPAPTTSACTGYHVVCAAQVGNLHTVPSTPRAGHGFTVGFSTESGGKYTITALRHGHTTATRLSTGIVGAGQDSVKGLGKHLKAGVYTLKVTMTANGKSAHARHTLTIKH